jgi:hypothetical protein
MKTRRSAPKPKWLIRAINDSKPIRLPRLAGKALSVWIPTLKEFPICQNLRVAPLDPMSGPSAFANKVLGILRSQPASFRKQEILDIVIEEGIAKEPASTRSAIAQALQYLKRKGLVRCAGWDWAARTHDPEGDV